MPIAGIDWWCHGLLSRRVYSSGGEMAFELQFFGATERVTGSLYVLTAGESRIVLECGLVQGMADEEVRNREPFPCDIEEIDAVVISHSHIDHSGRVPLLAKQGYAGPIYTHE